MQIMEAWYLPNSNLNYFDKAGKGNRCIIFITSLW